MLVIHFTENTCMAEVDIPESPESKHFRNLAEDLDEEDLKRIAEEAIAGYNSDKESMSELDKKREQYNKLFDLVNEVKNFPWPNASNIMLPVIITACINFQARASLNLLPSTNIAKIFPVDISKESEEKAARVSRHMNWQLLFDMPNFFKSWDKTLMMLPKDGYAFRKQYWDSVQQKVISTDILPQDFVINYHTKDLETSYRYTQVIHMTANEIKIKGDQGIYIDTDDVVEPMRAETDTVTLEARKNIGQAEPAAADYATPMPVLEQHTYIKLKKDDKIRSPYIVTINKETRKIHRIITRLNPETSKPLTYYTAYDFLPNPNSIFGYGFGQLLLGANHSMNTAINQLTDAAHLQNVKGGWVLENSGVSRGNLKFSMGEFKSVKSRVDDIRKAILPLEFSPPSPTLMSLISFLQDYVNSLTTVTELFTGAVPRSDSTATATTLAVEQGAKVFTGIQQRILRSFQHELQNIYDLNGIFLEEEEYINITMDESLVGKPEAMKIARNDYLEPFDVRPVADPNVISQSQLVGKAQMLAQVVSQNPFLAQNPEALKIVMQRQLEAVDEKPFVINQLAQLLDQQVQQLQQQQVAQTEAAIDETDAQMASQEEQQLLEEQAQLEQAIAQADKE